MSASLGTMSPPPQECSPEPGSRESVQPALDAVLNLYDWHLLVTTRTNALFEGPIPHTEAVLGMCTPSLTSPIGLWTGGPPTVRPETLVVREVGELTLDAQQVLLDWIDSAGHGVRILATSAQPLFPLVQHDAFLSELSYRLNVLRLDLGLQEA